MKSLNRTTAVVASVALSGFALAACSGSSSSPATTSAAPSSSSASGTPIGGGSAPCTAAQLTADVNTAINDSGAKVTKVQSFKCVNGWSYVVASTSTTGGPTVTSVYVFQAEGPYWIYKDLKTACGTSQATSQLPAGLYDAACKRTY